jgi:metallophosphoesterase (TIGR00282 family)
MGIVRTLMIGDVVGDPGIAALAAGLPGIIADYAADFVVVNGENAAGGFGLTAETLASILAAGADVVTTGNHVWEKRDVWPTLDAEERVLRPANYPPGVPGRGWVCVKKKNTVFCVINLQGREEMTPIDCPFRALDAILAEIKNQQASPIILLDFHAEATQEKEALAFYADGRLSALVGTHTHVQTADERLLPKGTAYITDLGMSGVRNAIIGMDTAICLNRNRTQVPFRMEIAVGPTAVRGVCVALDDQTGRAVSIERIKAYPD